MASVPQERRQQLSFTVQTLDCIACTPIFQRSLGKMAGVLEVKQLPITNKVIVVFDDARLDRESLVAEIDRISWRAGLGGKIIFHH